MASLVYSSFFEDVLKADIDFDSATFKCLLTTSSYTEDSDHNRRDDITNEVTGTGYTADGDSVTCTVTRDTANNRVDISLGAAQWTTATITARKAVYYQVVGSAATDRLVAVIDFGTDKTSSGGTFDLSASTIRIAV
jgi:hypothetical protein